jgi:Fur family ferric uptake transcriptional regulator
MARKISSEMREQARDAFFAYLRDRRIKNTSQRRAVLDAVLDFSDHFETEQVLYLLRERGAHVGKATLYRTLPLLVDCGILKQVRFDVKQAYYEYAFEEDPHDHMVCRRCGRITEFASDELLRLRRQIAKQHHFHVISHRLQLSGLCWECSIACPVATTPLPKIEEVARKRPKGRHGRGD